MGSTLRAILLVASHPAATPSLLRALHARRGRQGAGVGEKDELFYGGRQLGLAVRSTGCGAEAGETKSPFPGRGAVTQSGQPLRHDQQRPHSPSRLRHLRHYLNTSNNFYIYNTNNINNYSFSSPTTATTTPSPPLWPVRQ